MSDLLKEAFKELSSLKEDTFSFDKEGIFKLDNFLNSNEFKPDDIIVYDPEAEKEQELEDNYVGDVVLQCCVCESLIYKAPEEIIVDEETQRANIEEECPFCGCLGGYKVVGQVEPFEEEEELKIKWDEEEAPAEEAPLEESLETVSLDEYFHGVEMGEGWVDLDAAKQDTGYSEEEILEWVKAHPRKTYSLVFDGITIILTPTAPSYDSIAKELGLEESLEQPAEQPLTEDFQKAVVETEDATVSVESTEDGEVKVVAESKEDKTIAEDEEDENVESPEEGMLAPVEEETKEIIETEKKEESEEEEPEEEEEEIELEIEDFDEDDFNQLGESYLKEVYDNVASFKTTSGKLDENKIKLEGCITFNSGKKAKTSFIFEAAEASKAGHVKFIGENVQLTKKQNAFTLKGKVDNKKLMLESLNYNYTTKDNDNKSVNVYGTAKIRRQ